MRTTWYLLLYDFLKIEKHNIVGDFIIWAYSVKVLQELGASWDPGVCWGGPRHQCHHPTPNQEQGSRGALGSPRPMHWTLPRDQGLAEAGLGSVGPMARQGIALGSWRQALLLYHGVGADDLRGWYKVLDCEQGREAPGGTWDTQSWWWPRDPDLLSSQWKILNMLPF